MKIAFLGDSLTFGYGVPRKKNWVSLVGERLGAETLNFGVTGDTTAGLSVRLHTQVIPALPDIVCVMGGYNDILACGNSDGARSNMMGLICRAQAAGLIPVLGIPTQIISAEAKPEWAELFDFPGTEAARDAYAEWLRRFAKTFQVHTIDFAGELPKRMQANPAVGYLDGLHLNRAGHQAMAEIFEEGIRPLLETLEL